MTDLTLVIQRLVTWVRGLFRRNRLFLNTELEFRKRTLKLIDYFKGNQLGYLDELLSTQFSNPASLKMQMQISNVVAPIINELCATFKHGVTIDIQDGSDADQERMDEILDQVHFDSFVKTLEQYTYLCKTIFVKVSYLPTEQKMMLDIVTPEYVEVIPSVENPYAMQDIIYLKSVNNYDSFALPEGEFYHWTANTFEVVNEKRISLPNEGNPDKENPYGIIPIGVFRASYPTDGKFFIFPGEELSNNQDALNVKLTQLNNLIKYQSYGIGVFVNPPSDMYGNVDLQVDPSKPIVLRSNSKDEPADFKFVSPDAKIAEIQSSIDKDYLRLFAFYGLDPSDFIQTGNVQTAEAVLQNSAKIDEYRAQMKMVMIPQINELLKIMRVVWNTHNPNAPIVSEDFVVKIQSSKSHFETQDMMMKYVDWAISKNYLNHVDAMILMNDDMDSDEAKEALQINAEINSGIDEPEVLPTEPEVEDTTEIDPNSEDEINTNQ